MNTPVIQISRFCVQNRFLFSFQILLLSKNYLQGMEDEYLLRHTFLSQFWRNPGEASPLLYTLFKI